MGALPTVRIKSEGGYIIIKESDYDPETMELIKPERKRNTDPDPVTIKEVIAAIEAMDPDDNTLWTATTGAPKVEAIEAIIGKSITAALRDEVLGLLEDE